MSLAPAAPPEPGPVKLAVLIAFDQFRGDYLMRFRELFGPDGFERMLSEGAWFTECHYPYANTATGPGHASMLSGCSPDRHGIIGNNWYESATGDYVYCATESRYDRVPPLVVPPGKSPKKRDAGSPGRMLAPSLGDSVKAANRGRVVALSFKDRSSVLPAGAKGDAVYWFDSDDGQFVTSTFYRDTPHAWVKEFNASGAVRKWAGQTWNYLRPDLDYARYAGSDDQLGEGGVAGRKAFPHPLGLVDTPEQTKKYYSSLYTSPMGNEVLLDLVRKAVVAEKLGQGEGADLLSVSFSSNDAIGHAFGPDSHEVMDVTLRSDLIVRDLLKFLDDTVGRGRYLVAMTADHGVVPLPEVSQARKVDARRMLAPVTADAEAHLAKLFGRGDKRWIEYVAASGYYLNRRLMEARKVEPAKVEQALANWLRVQPGILTAYTRTQLLGEIPDTDPIGKRVKKSFHPDRSPDVQLVGKPYYLPGKETATGTTHGTPHRYDTHVPLVVFGPGVRKGARPDPVTPQAAAAILAHGLGVKPPAKAEAVVPPGLFAE